jgi:hypothetical protein
MEQGRGLRSTTNRLLLFVAVVVVCGRSHKETCSGCIVSLTTPTTSLLRASRSVSSRSLAEKDSRVFAASYSPRPGRW